MAKATNQTEELAKTAQEWGQKVLAFLGRHLNWLALPVFIILLVAMTTHYTAGYSRLQGTLGQYNEDVNTFNQDVKDLESYRLQYSYLPPDYNFTDKVQAGNLYATKAKESLTSWKYFTTFTQNNKGTLEGLGANATGFLSRIETARAKAISDAKQLAQRLQSSAETNENRKALITNVVQTLNGIS